MITEADTIKFQAAYKVKTGRDISSEDAFECVRNLVELLKRVYRPIEKKNYEVFHTKLKSMQYREIDKF